MCVSEGCIQCRCVGGGVWGEGCVCGGCVYGGYVKGYVNECAQSSDRQKFGDILTQETRLWFMSSYLFNV